MNALSSWVIRNLKIIVPLLLLMFAVLIFLLSRPREAPEPSPKQQQVEEEVKETFVDTNFLGLEHKGLFVEYRILESEVSNANKNSYVLKVENYSEGEVLKFLELGEIKYSVQDSIRAALNVTEQDFVRNYTKLLNDAVPEDKRKEIVFSLELVDKSTSLAEDENEQAVNVRMSAYSINLNGSMVVIKTQQGLVTIRAFDSASLGTQVTFPKFYPKSVSVVSKKTFKAGLAKLKPAVPKDPYFQTYFIASGRDFKPSDFSVLPGPASVLYIYDFDSNYIVSFLSKEARVLGVEPGVKSGYILVSFD